MVELGRGHAEVKQDAVGLVEALACEHLVEFAEIALAQPHALAHGCEPGLGILQRLVVAVDAQKRTRVGQTACDVIGMPCTAERRVDVHAVRPDVQRIQAGLK